MRAALTEHLSTKDSKVLDQLLEVDAPLGLTRTDLTVEGSRTAWAVRRP